MHSSVDSLRCVFLKVVRGSRLVKVLLKMYGLQAPRTISDFISRYCEIVSLISRGSSEYSISGCRAICKEDFRIRIKEGKDSSSFFTGLILQLVSFGELGL